MSMFLTKGTCMNDSKVLTKVLGTRFKGGIEAHTTPQKLFGYQGDEREQTAEIIVRRKFVGNASNDIGFKKNEKGNFDAIISSFDSGKHNDKWLGELGRDYLIEKTKSIMDEQGAEMVGSPTTLADGSIQMKFNRPAVYA